MMHPALPASVGDLHGHQRAEFVAVDSVVAVTDDAPVDVVGRDEGQRRRSVAEMSLEPRRVQQPERHIKVLAEKPLAVKVHLARMDDGSQPQQARPLVWGDATVVVVQPTGQAGIRRLSR